MYVLEERKMLGNTYIIFASDHGEMLGDHGLYIKHVAYEPSMHIPLIISGPGIEAGKESESMVELIDLHSTVCDLAQIGFNKDNYDSRSILPVLKGEKEEYRKDVISAERNYRTIRNSRYKYIKNYNDRDELYDMKEDPHELNNIIDTKRGQANK
ncbi:MAG: sulfatase [Bacillota bacterium]